MCLCFIKSLRYPGRCQISMNAVYKLCDTLECKMPHFLGTPLNETLSSYWMPYGADTEFYQPKDT